MNWKFKATIQNFVDCLPANLAYSFYYFIQCRFGGLRKEITFKDLQKSLKIIDFLDKMNHTVAGKTFLEVGTGRTLNVPIGLWLCGARKIITVDLNPYLKDDLVMKSIDWMRHHKDEIKQLFKKYSDTETGFDDRLNAITLFKQDINYLLKLINIDYMAPADASSLQLRDNEIDYHFSINVFEHIPFNIMKSILLEAKRLLNHEGLLVHLIDLSDHFSHSDPSITSINFLQFTEDQWKRWAGNRFMYHNRLRCYEYDALFTSIGMNILLKKENLDLRALEYINQGFPLAERFAGQPHRELAVSGLNVVGKFS